MDTMSSQNLETASQYVNNLLLSRGLLRNGTPLEFANPSKGKGGMEATMAKVINLIHDLVLRRDRETESLAVLSQNMTTVRTVSSQQSQTITRLETKASDLERQLTFAISQERTAKASLKSAEFRNKALREDMSRLKSTVAQIRGQCANDVRKRDAEIKRLQKHLEGRRGRGGGGPVGVTVVTPGLTKPKNFRATHHTSGDIESPTYSLKEETTEFLTQLSQDLSNENDALIILVRTTLATLRSLQGLPEQPEISSNDGAAFSDPNIDSNMIPSYKELAMNLDEVLEHLRNLLTNPSFVPLEEVELREDEIIRLREGWDKMETRWREAINLMNGWRKRMTESGDTINLEDLRKGLNLDSDPIPAYSSPKADTKASTEESSEDSILSEQSMAQEEQRMEKELESNIASPIKPSNSASTGLFPAPNILKASSGNAQRLSSPTRKSPRKVSFRANLPKVGALLEALDHSDDVALLDFIAMSPSKKQAAIQEDLHSFNPKPSTSHDYNNPQAEQQPDQEPEEEEEDEEDDGEEQEEGEQHLSIQQKLQQAQREAEEAKQRLATAAAATKPVKRTAIPRKVRSKRRSTLSPEELEGLMGDLEGGL